MRIYAKDYPNIQEALNVIEKNGGGELVVGKGLHKTGPLTLPSHLILTIEDDATIQFIDDPNLYTPVWSRWEGVECYALHPLVFASGQEDIVIRGSRNSAIREFADSPNIKGNAHLATANDEDGGKVRMNDSLDSENVDLIDAEQFLRSSNDHLTSEEQVIAGYAKHVGTIDGNGWHWWELFRENQNSNQTEPKYEYEKALAKLNPGYENQPGGGGRRETQYLRPPLVQFFDCKNVTLDGFNVMNSPFWTLHFVYCDGVTIKNMAIINPADAINTDAIDIDSSKNVEIIGCCIDVGDDAVTLKSGSGEDGLRVNKITENVNVFDCVIYASHGGIALGSETAGGIRNVHAKDCEFIGTQRAIRLKSRRSRGGVLENIVIEDAVMNDCWSAIVLSMYFQPGADPNSEKDKWIFNTEAEPVTQFTPVIREVVLKNIEATNIRSTAAFIVGLPESPIDNLEIENFTYTLANEEDLLPTWQTEVTAGLFHDENRGIKIINTNIKEKEGV